MKTAEYYVKGALQLILVQASEQPIQAPDAQDTLDAMNDFMLELESSLTLGYTEVTGLGDDVTIPDYARRMLKYNLAVNVADEYDAELKPNTRQIAQTSMNAVRRVTVPLPINILPDTLSVGAGNECGGGHYTRTFYPGDIEEDLLTEQAGNITLEEGTAEDE